MKKVFQIAGLTMVFALALFAAGCGSESGEELSDVQDTVGQASEGLTSSGPALKIQVLTDTNLGEEWGNQFAKGVQDELESSQSSNEMIDFTKASSYVDQAVTDGCDGIILAADGSMASDSVKQAREKGVPVVGLDDNLSNGYNTAAPDSMGKSMAQALVAQIAVQKGASAWGSEEDFNKQLARAAQGMWSNANSSGDQKQFAAPYVMEFTPNSAGNIELTRVSMITEIRQTPDENGYSYNLNTGNNYYLRPADPTTLECHWEPDGYSATDSLVRTKDISYEDGDGNSTFVVDMNSYSDGEEYFTGTISSFEGNSAAGDTEECMAINLKSPVRLMTANGEDLMIWSIQLNGDNLSSYANSGTTVKVTGTLFEAHTDHHFTPMLMNVTKVE